MDDDQHGKSAIPTVLLIPFGHTLPIIEAVLGILLLIEFKIKYMVNTALVMKSILILGSASIENRSAIEAQLLHSFYLLGLCWFYEKYNAETVNL